MATVVHHVQYVVQSLVECKDRGASTDILLSKEAPKVTVGEVRCNDHDWSALGAHSKER